VVALDPCNSPDGWVGAQRSFTAHDDSLGLDWSVYAQMGDALEGFVYVNPPYSKLRDWARKISAESLEDLRIISLIPARTDTRAWRIITEHADCVAFWRGRLTFEGASGPAPFPSALIAHNIGRRAMVRAFGDVADVWSCP
jgi:hypothetical protein